MVIFFKYYELSGIAKSCLITSDRFLSIIFERCVTAKPGEPAANVLLPFQSRVFGKLLKVRSLVIGHWSLGERRRTVISHWSLVIGKLLEVRSLEGGFGAIILNGCMDAWLHDCMGIEQFFYYQR